MQIGHFIGGEFVPSLSKETFVSINPATGKDLERVPLGSADDVGRAVEVAEAAFEKGPWRRATLAERARVLKRLGDLILRDLSQIAHLETLDTGKPISETRTGDVPRAALNFHFYSEFCTHDPMHTYRTEDGILHTTFREPLGVVGLITPWNLPLYLETWKVAPALAMGNSVVLKPAELTPLTAHWLAKLANEAGVPSGVLNIVHGFGADGAGEALVAHPRIKAISFTGETTTGQAIMKCGASTLKKMSFELGGKGASVIFADADVDAAVATACRAAFRNQGQVCLAGSRLLVEESIRERVEKVFREKMGSIVVGDPLDERTTMGALISKEHRDKVAGYVDYGRSQEGLQVVCGGPLPAGLEAGAFYSPILITDVPQSSRLIQEEIFGPVVTLQTFKTKEAALEMVNGTSFGLSCSIWTRNIETMGFMTRGVRSGLVWGNTWFSRDLHAAFGGMKSSGLGREGGRYSLDFFSELKTVSMNS